MIKRILLNESGTFYKINIVFCAELSETNCHAELSNAELSAPNCSAPNCPGTLKHIAHAPMVLLHRICVALSLLNILRMVYDGTEVVPSQQ